jgi:hypothetical protein
VPGPGIGIVAGADQGGRHRLVQRVDVGDDVPEPTRAGRLRRAGEELVDMPAAAVGGEDPDMDDGRGRRLVERPQRDVADRLPGGIRGEEPRVLIARLEIAEHLGGPALGAAERPVPEIVPIQRALDAGGHHRPVARAPS